MRHSLVFLMWLGLAGVVRSGVPAELLDRIPAGANALVVVDAVQLFGTPPAQRESWADAYADVFGSTPLLMPPDTTGMVLAAELDFQFLKPQWEIVLLDVTEQRTAELIATRTQGVVDQIAGLPAVKTPFEAYVVQLAPTRFAVLAPANRQATARWVRESGESPAASMSPYLRRMIDRARQTRAAIGMAIDLEHVISVPTARDELVRSDALRAHSIPADRAAEALASVQGATLLVTTSDRLEGALTIDFGEDVSFLGPAAGPFVIERLQRLGASMDQLKDWQATSRGSAVTMTGPLTASDLLNVLGVFRLSRSQPVHLAETGQSEQPKPAGSEGWTVQEELTRRYFQSIVNDVTQLQQSMTGASPYQFALWLDNCARRIAGRPWGNVDPDAVEYAKSVSNQLHELLVTLNTLDQQAVNQQAQVSPSVQRTFGLLPTDRTVNYGGYRMRQFVPYGYSQVDASGVTAQRLQIQQQTLEQANSAAQQVLAQIQHETETMRELLTKRYGGQF